MKFVEAKKMPKPDPREGSDPNASMPVSDKMRPGSRPDQQRAPSPDAKIVSLAKELNVDLNTVSGSGRNGAVTELDVRKAAAQAKE